jgi:hypothetical protein
MRSLSHHATREWLTTPCHRRRAFPSAVLRSDRNVRCGTYDAGAPSRHHPGVVVPGRRRHERDLDIGERPGGEIGQDVEVA